jgi:hypothetical protein
MIINTIQHFMLTNKWLFSPFAPFFLAFQAPDLLRRQCLLKPEMRSISMKGHFTLQKAILKNLRRDLM